MKAVYQKKEEGIAAVIGTLFALMIMTSLLTMFMTQYVPVYTKAIESEHNRNVLGQFSYMRSLIDTLILTNNVNYTAYVTLTLGVEGIPIFSTPSYGFLDVDSYVSDDPNDYENIHSLKINFTSNNGYDYSLSSGGNLDLYLHNHEYTEERIIYENGAVMRHNTAPSLLSPTVFIAEPHLNLNRYDSGGNTYLKIDNLVLQTLYGPVESLSGVDTKGIEFTLSGMDSETYTMNNTVNNVTFTIKSNYWVAWCNWLENKTYEAVGDLSYIDINTLYYRNGVAVGGTITLKHVYSAEITEAYIQMDIT
jgi:hypothetical protein